MRLRCVVLVLALGLASPLAGCLSAFEDATNPTPAFTLTADRDTFSDQVNLTATLVVERPWTFTSRGCSHARVQVNVSETRSIGLYGYEGVDDPFGGLSCAAVMGKLRLEPGTYTRTVSWNGHADGRHPDPHGGERLPPGEYVVHARMPSDDDRPSAEVVVRLL